MEARKAEAAASASGNQALNENFDVNEAIVCEDCKRR